MTSSTTRPQRQVQSLEAQRDAREEELSRLQTVASRALEWGMCLACQGAEALLTGLLDEDLGPASAQEAPGLLRDESMRKPGVHPTMTEALAQSREQLLVLRDAVRAREQRLADLQEQQDELLSIVAHDLRTPLVAIQGFTQLLQLSDETSPLTGKQREYVERVRQAVGSMNRLVEDLLTTRQLEQGGLSLRPRPVDPVRLVEDLLEIHREAARQKEVEIRFFRPDVLPVVRFDPDRVGQALGNLIQNAVKFTPRGRQVWVRAHTQASRIRFEVTDQGPGIEAELLPKLFDRTIRETSAEITGRGYGLGLFICREITTLHGGRFGAENLPEGGSRFWMELPLTSAETTSQNE